MKRPQRGRPITTAEIALIFGLPAWEVEAAAVRAHQAERAREDYDRSVRIRGMRDRLEGGYR